MFDINDKTKLSNNPSRSVLSITSPAKLNIISSEWSRENSKITKGVSLTRSSSLNIKRRLSKQLSLDSSLPSFNRPKIAGNAPPLLRRNSSFFKDDSNLLSMSSLVSNTKIDPSLSSSQHDADDISIKTDRFIPFLQSNSQIKIDPTAMTEELPPPTASPTAHLRAQTKMVFKQSVAAACGLKMDQRILEYMPKPPVASFNRRSYQLKKRTQYDYNHHQQHNPSDRIRLRKINTNPEKILDAPGFRDDFYLNLLSWSNKNILAIGLESAVYIWNADTGDVTLLVDFENTMVTSITWSDDECHISIGKEDGNTEIWDTETMSLVRTMRSNLGVRISSQSWLETLIATGARSGEIHINDVRIKKHIVSTWEEHTGEVCGLSYKKDGLQLASGGNDNTVMIWDTRTSLPQWTKRNHNAAIKALSWCPYMPNILASGGGQNDKHIHFWNSTTGTKVGSINTGSQVSSLHWGQSYNSNGTMNREIVATGGNPENAISVFNFDTKYKVAEIVRAHESRICSSQLSPDGTTLASVGGDENLKFYKIFEPRRKPKRSKGSSVENVMSLFGSINNEALDDSNSETQERTTKTQTSRKNSYIIR